MPDAASPAATLDVDRVYVIHVRKGAEDRAAFIERQLARLGIEFEYVLDGDRDQLTPQVMARWFHGAMATPTADTSCSFKHLTACERIVRDGHDTALVLEDDIVLPAHFVEALNRSITELRTRADASAGIGYISLENTGLETFIPPVDGHTLVRADHGRAAGAYWLSRGAAERLLHRAERERLGEPFDHFQNRLARTGEIELWWRHPAIAEQGSHNGMFNSMLAPDRAGPLRRLKWRARKAWQLGIRPLLARFYPVLLALTALVAGAYLLSALDAQETRVLEDSSRNRRITIAIYQPPASTECTPAAPCPVALLSTGHGMKNGQYAFLARAMARLGYLVVGIQHEQPGDPDLPFAGNMMVLRMPFWRTGVANLQFVRATLRHDYPQYDWDHLTLVGHSHGGDVSALLAQEQPALVTALVTLDNRRYPLPRTASPRVLSIRAGRDIPADPGVIPDAAAQASVGLRVVTIEEAAHGDLTSMGPRDVQAKVIALVTEFLTAPAGRS